MKSLLLNSLLAVLLLGLTSCLSNGQFGIKGEGPVVDRKISLDRMSGVSLESSAKVYLTQGSPQEVRITGQENIIENLNQNVSGEVWHIGNKRSVWQSEPIRIYITLEDLRMARITGSGTINCENHFSDQKDLDIRISGSGKISLDIKARDINANISGSGDLSLKGIGRDLDLTISGAGNIYAYDLDAQRADARISGSGGMQLSVGDRISAHISGSGSIRYQGNPKVDSSVSGSGNVRSR